MGQYDIAELLLESDTPLSRSDIARKIDRSSSTAGYGLRQLEKKDYVVKKGTEFELAEDIGESEVESLKPTPIGDAVNQDKE